jgi:small GTP-binding protein
MFKLLVVGESSVGKTCLLMRFADNVYNEDCITTIGVDSKVKELTVDDKRVKLQIWDSAGQERFRNITASYYRNSSGIIVVYDVTKNETFERVSDWVQEVRRYVPSVPLMLVGNKSDLVDLRQVTPEAGKDLAQRQGMIFFETSARTNSNIDAAFEELSRKLIETESRRPAVPGGTGRVILIDKPRERPQESQGCC